MTLFRFFWLCLLSVASVVACSGPTIILPPNQTYLLGGEVIGLTGSLQLQNANDILTLHPGTTSFSFVQPLAAGASYNVVVNQQPIGQTCVVSNGQGVVHQNVSDITVTCSTQVPSVSMYSVFVTVTGLNGSLGLFNNGIDSLTIIENGTYAFTTSLVNGAVYNVTVAANPQGQTCDITHATGSIEGSDVSNIQVICQTVPVTYAVNVTVSGLNGVLTLADNGNDMLQIDNNGVFAFATSLLAGQAYDVIIVDNPNQQSCVIQNASGVVGVADINNIEVSCQNLVQYFDVGVSVTGLVGFLTLQNNGHDSLTMNTDGNYQFSTSVPTGATYAVTILNQPTGQTCTVSNGGGIIDFASPGNIQVSCMGLYTVSVGVSGVSGSLVLQNNGGDNLTITADGTYTFATTLLNQAPYTISILSQSANQLCTLSQGSGTINAASVGNASVSCVEFYRVGLSVSGLSGMLVLQNNGGDNLTVTADGTYAFATSLLSQNAYTVTIFSQPANQLCTLSQSTGTIGTASEGGVGVVCVNVYTVSVNVSGLAGTLVLQNNGEDNISITSQGSATFATSLSDQASYDVTVLVQPTGQQCTITGGSGVVAASNVANINIACVNVYTVSLSVSGLSGTLMLQNNGDDNLSIAGNGTYVFSGALPNQASYHVIVLIQPAGQWCTVAGGSGSIDSANILNVNVSCVNVYTVAVDVLDVSGMLVLQNNGADDIDISASGTYVFASRLMSGDSYAVHVLNQPQGELCTVTNSSGIIAGSNIANISVSCLPVYNISVNVSGLTGALVLQNNGEDNLSITSNGPATFASAMVNGSSYAVSVYTQPTDQLCSVTAGSGIVSAANVNHVNILCVDVYTVSVNVSGLSGGTLVLQNNGGDMLSIGASGTNTFATALFSQSSYNVTVLTQPMGQICVVSNGSGTVDSANIHDVNIVCATDQTTYAVNPVVMGLAGTLVLQNNGGDNLNIGADGTYTFANHLINNVSYTVSVLTQPSGQICSVNNSHGTIAAADVDNIVVSCVDAYTVSANVSGLSGTLVLQNNNGDNLSITSNGTSTFVTPLLSQASYSVAVLTQPTGQLCTITSGVGTITTANITNVEVSCVNVYTVSTSITGLSGTLVLQNNGVGNLSVTSDGAYTFSAALLNNASYQVEILTQPAGQFCTVSNASGIISLANVNNVNVTCLNVYTVYVDVSGLSGMLVLQNNHSDNLSVTSDGTYAFHATVLNNASYAVSVLNQPSGQMCSVSNSSGTIAATNVSNIAVSCVNIYTVSVTVSGLSGTLILQDNGGDNLSITSNEVYTFATVLLNNASYAVTVLTQPSGQSCFVNNGSGMIAGTNVNNIAISCANVYTVSASVSGLSGALVLQDNGTDNLSITSNGTYTFALALFNQASYAVTVLAQPTGQLCTINNGSGSIVAANIGNVAVSCVSIYTVSASVSGLSGTLVLQNNGGDNLNITNDGTYTFSTALLNNTSYQVEILTQPGGQSCAVSNSSGMIFSDNATNVNVTCFNIYTVYVDVSGLSGTLILQNNDSDNLSITSDGTYAFPTAVLNNAAYAVSVLNQPSGQVCSVSNSSGTIAATNVSNIAVSCVNIYTVSATVSGLSGTLVLQNNGGDNLSVTSNEIYTFATALLNNASYTVTVLTQPNGQICHVSNGSGNIADTDVSNVAISCANAYTVSASVSGLSGTLVLQDNGTDNLSITSDGTYTFVTALFNQASYAVTVLTQPTGQLCTVSSGSGGINSANISNVAVSCINTYTVSANVSGLSGTLVLQNNGGDNLSITSDGTYAFATALLNNASYGITMLDHPAGQVCTVNNGNGTIAAVNVSSISVHCVSIYKISLSVSGLSGSLVLQNNGGDNLSVTSDGTYTFATDLLNNASYQVGILAQPTGQSCAVSNASGVISSANVINVNVTCLDVYTVYVDVSGLSGTLILQNNYSDNLSVTSDGTYAFPVTVLNNASYAISVFAQPSGQMCSVSNSSGIISAADVSNIAVSCVDIYTVSVTVSGLSGTLVLQNNGDDNLNVTSNGTYTFATALLNNASYAATILNSSAGQICTVSNGSGTIQAANVSNVSVSCANIYTLSASVSGLSGTLVLQNNGGDNLNITSNGTYTFATALLNSASYATTILTQPTGQICTVSNGSGTVQAANVSNITVSCVNIYTASASVSGLSGTLVLQNNGGDNLNITSNGTYTFATALLNNASYAVTILTPSADQICTVNNGSGTIQATNVSNVFVSCVNIYTVSASVSGLSGTLVLQDNDSDNLNITSNGNYTFATALFDDSSYHITVLTQPTGQWCSVTGSSGVVASANVVNVDVSCVNVYTVGLSVSGLSGTLVLQNNGVDNLSVTSDGSYTFTPSLVSGASYAASVLSQPQGQLCTVTNGSGVIASSDIGNISVSCVFIYTVSINVSGLSGTLVVQNNGDDNLNITSNGTYTFATALLDNAAYAATILNSSAGQICTVSNGSGTISAANVSNITVSCVNIYTVSASVSGLSGTLVLQNNGSDNLNITSNGTYTFATTLLNNDSYAVTILNSSTGQICTVGSGSGTIQAANVSNITVSCVNIYTVSASVSGLSGTLVLQNNGGDNLSITSNGTYTFATALLNSASYAVTVFGQPMGQICAVSNGSGTVQAANVSNVSVLCVNIYTVSASVSGLSGTLVLQNNGDDNLNITSNGTYTFATALLNNASYNATILSPSIGQICTVSNGSGTVQAANVSNIAVSCVNIYTVSASVSGLSGTLVLQNNGGDNLNITSNGTYTFATALLNSASYAATILIQPTGQICTVSNGSGTVQAANVSNIAVSCVNIYTVSASVSGLSGTLVLQNNGGDNLNITSNGTYTFATALLSNASYNITVLTQPTGQWCSITGGSGVVASANVVNVAVSCVNVYTVGLSVSGLSGTLVLQNNGVDNLSVTSDGTYTFTSSLVSGASYATSVLSQPQGQLCTVTNGSGTIASSNVTNISVSCVFIYTVSVNVSGLSGTLVVQNNGGDNLSVTNNQTYTFATALLNNASYAATILTQPTGQMCTVNNGSGTISAANVGNITVSCVNIYTVSASISGLSGTLVLQNNGGDNLNVTSNGTYTFATTLLNSASYVVTVLTQPAGQACSVSNGSGTVQAANISNVSVSCANIYTLSASVSGLSGTLVLQNNGGDNLNITSNGTYTFATALLNSASYAATILTQPTGQICTVSNGSGTVQAANVSNTAVSCVNIYTVSASVLGLSGTLVLQNNGGDNLNITSNGTYTFATALLSDASYNITVLTQPTSQWCSITGGSGIVASANVVNVAVSCVNVYTVGLSVSGLSGTLVLQNNGVDNLSITSDGTYIFTPSLVSGASYAASVLSQPQGQLCTITNGSGTIASSNVTNISVSCVFIYTVSVNVSGLSGTLVAQNNGGDNLSIQANGTFAFATSLFSQNPYAVTVLTQPSGQLCGVTGGSGLIGSANVTNINIACVDTYTLSASVSGLSGTLVLQNNGGDNLSITSNGSATFASAMINGSSYAVTVFTQPAGQLCSVASGSGTISAANVSNIAVSCVNIYTLSANVSGLSGGTLVLQNNGSDSLSITASGTGTFPTALLDQAAYSVTVLTQPTGQTCTVSNGSGTVSSANVGNVNINCTTIEITYAVDVSVSGLSGTLVLQNNGGDNLNMSADGTYTFATHLISSSAYAVTVLSQPSAQLCTVTNGTGTIASSEISNISVACVNIYTVSAGVSGLSGTLVLQNNNSDNLSVTANGTYMFATVLLNQASYNVTVLTQPAGQLCTVTSGSGTIAAANITNVAVSCVNVYTVSMSVSGLSGTLVLQNNGGNNLSITSSGNYTFAASLFANASYAVTVLTQPNGQRCSVSNGSGTIAASNISNIGVSCVNVYTVSAGISGLSGTLILQNNSGDNLSITSNGTYAFATALVNNASYAVTVFGQPTGQTCVVNNASGTISAANVSNITVSCVNIYTVSASVSGLSGTLILQDNGGDNLSVTSSGTYTFATTLLNNAAYAVTILTQPTGQICTMSNGSGTIQAANVSNVSVSCANIYTVSASVSGLSGTLVLQNNGGDNLSITSNGTYAFATALLDNASYAVSISTQPTGQTCTVSNGSGTIQAANVSNITVSCVNIYTVSVGVSGLSGTLVLQDNGADNLNITSNGTSTFATALLNNTSYAVAILTQPTGQTCTLSNGSGTIQAANISNITVLCVNIYTVSASVSGLSGTLVLQNNGGDNLSITSNGTYTFATALLNNASYAATILTQPTGQACSVSNSSGTIQAANVGNIAVSCVNIYTVSASVSGLSGTLVLQNNGGDNLSITSNGTYTFAIALLNNASYAVTILTQSTGQTCTVSNGSGTVLASNVSNITVSCVNIYTVSVSVAGLSGTLILQNNGGDNLNITSNGARTFATALLNNASYAVTILTQPAGQTCTLSNSSGTVLASNVSNITVSCVNIYTVSASVSGLSGTLVLQNNGSDNLNITSNGTYTFAISLLNNASYAVTSLSSPGGQMCTVSNGSGTIQAANVSNVSVSCINVYTVSASVSGLSGTLVLQDNGGDNLNITSNGTSTFAAALLNNASYAVGILTQPTGQMCTVSNGSGTISAANVSNIAVSCLNIYTVSATVSGLSGTLVLQDNGGDNLNITSNGTSTFAAALLTNASYTVSVLTQPTGQRCTVNNGNGTISATNVSNVSVSCVNVYTVSTSVSGLSGTLVLQDNGGDNLSVTSNGTSTFATALLNNASYAVSVLTQPTGQKCTVSSGSGTISAANVSNVSVSCVNIYTVSASVSGLSGTLVLQDNGGDNLNITSNGTSTFATALLNNASYAVNVLTQPTGQKCTVSNGIGTISAANVSNISVSCVNVYTVSVTVSGLSGTLVLQDNGGDSLSITSNGTSTFATALLNNASYAVSVLTQPTGQRCTVSNGSGTISAANVSNVAVSCVNVYTVSATVSGLSGTLVLQNNGGDNLSTTTNGARVFATALLNNVSYAVSVLTQPTGQRCTVINGSGTISAANVSNISVSCVNVYTVSASVSGLSGTLVLQNNGGDNLNITSNGTSTFATALLNNASYAVGIFTQPTGQTCTVTNGSGTISAANVSNIAVSCVNIYTVSVSVLGLSGTLILQDNGGDNLNITSNGTSTFATALLNNAAYAVTVSSQPTGQTCTVSNGSGTISAANVSNISVSCVNVYTVSATVSGLSGTLVLQDNGIDNLSITTNGSRTFATSLLNSASYAVTVFTQPTGQKCTVSNGSGTISAANVSNITVSCVNVYTVSATVSGLSGTLVLQDNGGDNLNITSNGTFTFATSLLNNASYAVTVSSQPTGQTCSVSNGSGTIPTSNVSNISVSCVNVYTISATVSGLSGTLVLQDNGGDNLSITTNGIRTFATSLLNSASYAVTVFTQPTGQTCTVSNGSGTISAANVSNITVSCVNVYTVSVTVSGLSGTLVLQDNGGDNLSITTIGSRTFATSLLNSAAYAVTVFTQPSGQKCTVTNGSGTISAANVSNITVSCVNVYTVSVSVSGLSGTLVLQDNGGDNLSITNNGTSTFATSLLNSAAYAVAVFTQPTGQKCTVSNGSGTISAANVSNITVSCVNVYTVSATISGLSGTLVLQNNGGDNLNITSNGTSIFATSLLNGAAYAVAVFTQPTGQTCTVTNGSGTISAANVSNITVSCVSLYAVSVNVQGFYQNTLTLQNNGSNNLNVAALGNFGGPPYSFGTGTYTFSNSIQSGQNYNVTVASNHVCNANNTSGVVSNANISNINMVCTDGYSVGVHVSGASGSLVLQSMQDNLNVASNGNYIFPTILWNSATYNVVALTPPAGQSCTVSNGSGTVALANVSGVNVACSNIASPYTISFNVTGLSGNLVVQNNSGNNTSVTSNGTYTFSSSIANGSTYNVTVLSYPPNQTCTVTNGSGTVSSSNVSNVNIACSNIVGYSISTNVSGFLSSLGSLKVYNNNGDSISISGNGTYTFPTIVSNGYSYSVTAYFIISNYQTRYTQICTVTNGSGTVSSANVLNVNVSCVVESFFGVVAQLNGSDGGGVYAMLLQGNLLRNGGFISYGEIPFGSNANFQVVASPPGYSCSVPTLNYPWTGDWAAYVNCTGASASQNAQNANVVLGQANFTSSSANAGGGGPSASGVGPNSHGNPAVINNVLYVPDPNNNRILGFAEPLSTGATASIVVGQSNASNNGAGLTAGSFNTPYSIASDGNYFVVADSKNNRVLIYSSAPSATGYPTASAVIGQSDYVSNSSGCSATTLNSPQDVSIFGSTLVVADTNNNRVLLYQGIPTGAGAAANIVFGQSNMTTCTSGATQSTLNTPRGVLAYYGFLLVADTGNNRVMGWGDYFSSNSLATIPLGNGSNAGFVLGQTNYTNKTSGATQTKMSSPSYLATLNGSLFVADTGNNRVLIYDMMPWQTASPDHVLGQVSFTNSTCNKPGSGSPTINGLCSPLGLAVDVAKSLLIVNDSGNNRYVTYLSP